MSFSRQALCEYAFGIFRPFFALSSSIPLEIHKVFLREMDLDRTKNHPKSALADSPVAYFGIL